MKELIKKILKEETEEMSPIEQTVADFVNMSLNDYELPEEFYKVSVDVFNDGYGRQECAITSLFEKPFKLNDSDKMHFIMNKIKRDVNDYFGNVFSHIAFGSSTVSNYNDTRDWYTKRKNKNVNEEEVELTERCWKGYTQKGFKTMFGKRYPNCVKRRKK